MLSPNERRALFDRLDWLTPLRLEFAIHGVAHGLPASLDELRFREDGAQIMLVLDDACLTLPGPDVACPMVAAVLRFQGREAECELVPVTRTLVMLRILSITMASTGKRQHERVRPDRNLQLQFFSGESPATFAAAVADFSVGGVGILVAPEDHGVAMTVTAVRISWAEVQLTVSVRIRNVSVLGERLRIGVELIADEGQRKVLGEMLTRVGTGA